MDKKNDYLSRYYGKDGEYLNEHKSFLEEADIKQDIIFLTKVLEIKNNDNILDIACGQGRHVQALSNDGFFVDGVDFSSHLLDKAKKMTKSISGHHPEYFLSNVENLRLDKKYNKIYWFFSDFAGINIAKAIKSICNSLEKDGLIIIDSDSFFRIVSYMSNNPSQDFSFDAKNLVLIDNKNKIRIPYPVYPMWEKWLNECGCIVDSIFGDYDFSEYSIKSPRLILKIKKTV